MSQTRPTLFVPPGHFYSPIPDPGEVAAHLERRGKRPLHGIDLDMDAMRGVFSDIAARSADMPFTWDRQPNYRYYYGNDQFTYGDAAVLFAMMDRLRPARVIEIGSGHSSALLLDARDSLGIDTYLSFIEPYPTRLDALLRDADRDGVTVHRKKVQDVPLVTFDALQANDILIIDSSHVAKTGSDVCFEIFEILPRLKPGVRVMIHDMFDGFEYPRQWSVDEGRAWNELYLVRAFLMFNDRVEIEFFNDAFAAANKKLVKDTAGPFAQNPGGSLWLTIADPKA